MTNEKDKDDKSKSTTTAAASKETKPTGTEHWGEGGEFRIDANGKRVRKPIKKEG